MTTDANTMRLRIRLDFGGGAMFGPGKADLLTLIAETGSIAAAGRKLGMSYKRAWGLVEQMNAAFEAPVVESKRGGANRGGATLTDTGRHVLALYRDLESKTRSAGSGELDAFERLLSSPSRRALTDAPLDK